MENFVRQCALCQRAEHEPVDTVCLLTLPISAGAWQDIATGFVKGLPKSEDYDVIMVVVDRFTKYAHFFHLKHPFSAKTVARLMLDNVVKLHGVPPSIISDRNKIISE